MTFSDYRPPSSCAVGVPCRHTRDQNGKDTMWRTFQTFQEVGMRGAVLFGAGLLVGLAVHVGLAQNAAPKPEAKAGVVMMNHVGINVPNIDEAVTYYTQKMGYREAFRVFDDKKQPRLVY